MKKKKQQPLAQKALALHKKLGGKLGTCGLVRVTKETFPLLYTPGVSAVSKKIAMQPDSVKDYTLKGRTVAVISDGSAVLGLGNIGPEAALPVMEGKALLFKELGGIDAVPLVLDTQNPDEIVETVIALAPTFGGINLEDIAAPKCFDIERRLIESLSIPVVHDDQHATAIVVLAGLINAHKVVRKNLTRSRIAIIGAGAAGTAIARLLVRYGVGDVVVVDRHGIIGPLRTDLAPEKERLVEITNNEKRTGSALEALAGADAVVGVSCPGAFSADHVRIMAQRPIVFALANPIPELEPDEAIAAGAVVVATGSSNFPNQINNVLVFPGMFRGALTNGTRRITTVMKLKAAKKLASLTPKPTAKKIIPTVFDKRVAKAIASTIK